MTLTKVSTPGIKDEAITLAKLLHGDSNNNGKFLRANNGADPTFEDVAAAVGASGNLQYSDGSGGFASSNTHKITGDSLFTHDLYLSRDSSNVDPVIQPGAQANVTYRTSTTVSGAFGSILDGTGLQLGRNTQYVKLKALSDQTGQQSYDFAFPVNPGSNGQALITDGSGNTSWSTISSDLVDDTSPQLGADLDTNSRSINFGDSSGGGVNRLQLGASQDLRLFHSTSGNSLIDNTTGALYIRADDLYLASYASTETYLRGISNGAVELYWNNKLSLFTHGGGTDIQADGSTVEMKLRTAGGTVRGWLYANDSNQVGLLDEGGNWAILHYNDNYTQFRITNVVKARIDGDGLKFGNDTAAANALDDYEEGTWTLTQGNFTTFSLSSSQNVGRYVKIGGLVTCWFEQNGGSLAWSTPQWVGGLPFSVQQAGAGSFTNNYPNAGGEILVYYSERLYFAQSDGYNTTNYRAVFTFSYKTTS